MTRAEALAFLGTGAVVLKHEEEEENVNRRALDGSSNSEAPLTIIAAKIKEVKRPGPKKTY